jgi:Excalibur calcium-binding domain
MISPITPWPLDVVVLGLALLVLAAAVLTTDLLRNRSWCFQPTGARRRGRWGLHLRLSDNDPQRAPAGAASIRRGDPGYNKHLDGDGDGKGCGRRLGQHRWVRLEFEARRRRALDVLHPALCVDVEPATAANYANALRPGCGCDSVTGGCSRSPSRTSTTSSADCPSDAVEIGTADEW